MIVVCDASPLIFLAKLNRLDLILRLLGPEVVVLKCVVAEVKGGGTAGEIEQKRLDGLLQAVRVVAFAESSHAAGRLSFSDRQTLSYAIRQRADWLLTDERLLRRVAREEGLATIGTLGLLVAAVKRGHLSASDALRDLDSAVGKHRMRVSIALYPHFRAAVAG